MRKEKGHGELVPHTGPRYAVVEPSPAWGRIMVRRGSPCPGIISSHLCNPTRSPLPILILKTSL